MSTCRWLCALLLVPILGCSEGSPRSGPAEVTAPVVGVVDGDTIDVQLAGTIEPVRLIGIDAPERGECGHAEATAALGQLVEGRDVRLETDVSDRDDFGRLLRHVWIDDVLVSEVLVGRGLVLARRYPPDTRRAGRLESAETEARRAASGLWSGAMCGSRSDARLEVGDIRFDSAGDDESNPNGEWIEIVNRSEVAVDLSGWVVRDESATHRYRFRDGFALAAGASVRLHTGCGMDAPRHIYWCVTGSAVWNNTGDTVMLLDSSGDVAASRSYGG